MRFPSKHRYKILPSFVLAAGLLAVPTANSRAQTITTLVSDTTWQQSTTVLTATADDNPWSGVPVTLLPDASTYTDATLAGANQVNPLPGATNLFSGSGIHFFHSSFDLAAFSAVSIDLQTFVDNDIDIFINGTELAQIGTLNTTNFLGGQPLRVGVAADGTVTNGYLGGQSFARVAPSFPNSLLHTGSNDVVLAVRNLNGSDSGGFSFHADFDVTALPTGGAAAPEPGSMALVASAALLPLLGSLRRRCAR